MNIYLDQQIEKRGHSVVKEYEDEDGYISRGFTCYAPSLPVLMITFNIFDFSIVCGKKEYDEWTEMLTRSKQQLFRPIVYNEEANKFMWSIFFSAMTKDHLKKILDRKFDQGFTTGRESKRMEFVKLFE